MKATQSAGQTRSRPKQVIEHYNISHMTLWRWRQQDDFPQPLTRGRIVLYDIAAIDSWLEGVQK